MAHFVIALKRNRENEASFNVQECEPIRNAPPGKMYVRCPCNCLFLCKSSSQSISCPKPNCKRIINLTDLTPNPILGMRKVGCAHCHDTFLLNTFNGLVRCPNCRKVSSVGPNNFARRRGIALIFVGIITLVIAIALTVGTYIYEGNGGLYLIYIVGFLLGLLSLGRGIYYCTMKNSLIEDPV